MSQTDRKGLQHVSEVIYEIFPHLKPKAKNKTNKKH